MFPGPVFNAELLTTARRPRYFVVRFVYGMLLLYFIWGSDPRFHPSVQDPDGYSIHQLAIIGQSLFRTFFMVQSVAVLLLIPALVAGAIADERQRKTLHYLLATPLSPLEIVLGKLAARMIHVGVLLAIGIPVMSLASLFGGVDPNLLLLGFAATVSTAFFLSSLAILVSVHARRPREAISLTYMLEAFWLFVPPLTMVLMPMSGPFWLQVYAAIKPVNDWIATTSPMTFLIVGGPWMPRGPRLIESILWMIGLQLAYGAVFVLVALLRLRPASRSDGEGVRRFAAVRRWARPGRIFVRPECGDDAMMWKERYVSRTSLATKVVTAFVVVLGLCGLAVLTFDYARPAFEENGFYGYGTTGVTTARDAFNRYLRVTCTLLYVLWALALASAASSGLTSEREEDTWTSLMSTPLSGEEILRAKMFGAFWGLRWAGLLLLALWITGLAAGAIDPVGFAAVLLETAIFLGFVVTLGTAFSLHLRTSSRSLVATVGLLIFLNGGYLLCCIPFQPSTAFISLGVTPMIEAVSLMTYDELRSVFSPDGRRGYGYDRGEMILACVIGTIGYSLGAWILALRSSAQFDTVVDRPRRPMIDEARVAIAYDGEVEDMSKGTNPDASEPSADAP